MSAPPVVFVPFSESAQPFIGSQSAIEVKKEVKESDSVPEPVELSAEPLVLYSEGRNEEETSTAHEIMMDFNEDMIRVLLDLYKSHCGKMSNSRNNNEKAMWWEKMASEFNAKFDTSFSKKRLRTKVNNLKNKLRRFEDQHRISGDGEIKIKMHKDLLDVFGNITAGVEAPKHHEATSCEASRDNLGAEYFQGAARKLIRNSYKLDKLGTVGEDIFVMRERDRLQQEMAEKEKAKRRAREQLEEKESVKRRRAEVDEDRGHKRLAKEEEEKKVEQQTTKESDEERRHREIMSVAQGILAALNKIVDKL